VSVRRSPSPARERAAADATAPDTAPDATAAALAANPVWYHTLELPGGALTPGQIDLRRVAGKLLPATLTGARALDVGTFDGFWAFELERRGAEVVAIDIADVGQAQLPPDARESVEREARAFGIELGRGFALAAELLSSRVRRIECDVLELTPEASGGPVDVVFVGALLVHMRDPVQALERIRDVLVPGGRLYQLEAVSLWLSALHPRRPVAHLQTLCTSFNWWYPNDAMLRAWLRTAGFADVRGHGLYRPPQKRPMHDWYRGLCARRPA
jgi:SAM-dependent methyltransferase